MLTRDQIQQHINDLDAQIPKEDAELLIWYEGDSSGCEIMGNYIGYLRFGIEILKAAVVDLEPGTVGTNTSIDYMEVPKWCLHVKRIIRRENVREFSPQFPVITWKTYAVTCCEVSLGFFAIACLATGFWVILVWVWHLLV